MSAPRHRDGAPSAGGRVRVESIDARYWLKRFSGARRLDVAENTRFADARFADARSPDAPEPRDALRSAGVDLDGMSAELGSRWHFADTAIKPYPVCRWAQPAIEAALAVRRAHDLRPDMIEEIEIEGVRVPIFNLPKTVADCFKFRNKIGLDVAREALAETLRGRRASVDELWRYAGIARVTRVMRPYLEAMA